LFNQLLGRGSAPEAEIDASVIHRFFNDKVGVAAVRTATTDADAVNF